MLIHFIFTFQKTFKPFVFTISVSLWNSRWHLGELKNTHKTIEGDFPIWKPLA